MEFEILLKLTSGHCVYELMVGKTHSDPTFAQNSENLIFFRYDRLRLLHVPSNLVSVIRECVNKQWYLQLLKTKDYHGTTELKLGGCPWWADGNDAVEARYFISSLVGTLKSNGWEVCGTIDLSRHNNDKSTLLLKQCRPSFAPHMCVSFNKANRIRLIVSR